MELERYNMWVCVVKPETGCLPETHVFISCVNLQQRKPNLLRWDSNNLNLNMQVLMIVFEGILSCQSFKLKLSYVEKGTDLELCK